MLQNMHGNLPVTFIIPLNWIVMPRDDTIVDMCIHFVLLQNLRLQYACMNFIWKEVGIHKVSVLSCIIFSLLILEVSEDLFWLAAVMSFCLALCVGDSGNVVRYKADKKDEHNAEYITARFLLDWYGILSGLEVGLKDLLCDSSVEDD